MSKAPQKIYICFHPYNDADAWQSANKDVVIDQFTEELATASGAKLITWEPDGVTRDVTVDIASECAEAYHSNEGGKMYDCPEWVRNTAYGLSTDEGISYDQAKAVCLETHEFAWSGDNLIEKVE